MGMTIAEKILARKGGQTRVAAGDLVTVKVDTVVLFDNNFMPSIWQEMLKLEHPERIVVMLDHRVPAPNHTERRRASHRRARSSRNSASRAFTTSAARRASAISVVADHGYALPGTVLVCSDSHTCSAGAFNCLARGVGGPDVMYAATKGKTWFRVGETVRYELTGQLRRGVSRRRTCSCISPARYGEHATQNVEYGGPGMANLSHQRAQDADDDGRGAVVRSSRRSRRTSADRLPERARNPSAESSRCIRTRMRVFRRAASSIWAASNRWSRCPTRCSRTRARWQGRAGTRIDQAFIGSCANGTLDDLALAARVVKGRKCRRRTRAYRHAGSQRCLSRGAALGRDRRRSLEAGAVITTDLRRLRRRAHGRAGDDEVCITASTRNFKGRMGDPSARSTWARQRPSPRPRFVA